MDDGDLGSSLSTGEVVPLLFILILAILSSLLFGEIMLASLHKLHLSSSVALTLVIAMFAGGLVNIPVRRVRRSKDITRHPLAIYGLAEVWPELRRAVPETIIAVNFGGCLIPVGLAFYEIAYLATLGVSTLIAVAVGCGVNIIVCYSIARPVQGVGIAMPSFVSPIAAVTLALVLAPEAAPPVAFVIGVVGPLVGADLLHLRDIEATDIGVVSIGGAGTFDGIILSGILAAYLA
ncbi:hypothetical protein GALL_504320 [mine drainage metagenome]|uniref:Membrane protein containing DUF1614 n=1 Tax=mine drainage metagenome TaxID=410659 RepID=A0A1J5P9M1_9ZZZZ